jgi:MoxR-like ATPase
MNEMHDSAILDQVEATIDRFTRVRSEIGRAIFGQERVIEESLITLLAGGHVLLVGVPGLAKTRLVETLGVVLGLTQKRVQFTPDLMPADILDRRCSRNPRAGGAASASSPGRCSASC